MVRFVFSVSVILTVWMPNSNVEAISSELITASEIGLAFGDPEYCIANAGDDKAYCETSDVNLSAKPSAHPDVKGKWTQSVDQDRSGILIVNPYDPFTAVEGFQSGNEYKFIWTLESQVCKIASFDKVNIFIDEKPDLYPEELQLIYSCGFEAAILEARTPLGTFGIWNAMDSDLKIEFPENSFTPVSGLKPGQNLITWSLSTEGCKNIQVDSFIILMDEQPRIDTRKIQTDINEDIFVSLFNVDLAGFEFENWIVEIIEEPAFGKVVANFDKNLTYIPLQNFSGYDQFTYQLCNINCANQCHQATIEITINDTPHCEPPSIITPNNDGINDFFVIDCEVIRANPELIIFDSNGQQIFSDKTYNNDFDGKLDGKDLPEGTYFYVLRLNDTTNEIIQGFFMIHR